MESQKVAHSLPPQVEGQLRCFLRINAGKLNWSISSPPKVIQLLPLWWGENKRSLYLRPEVANDPNSISKAEQREIYYPIRCGPKQFTSYLKDMGQLHMDVVYGSSLTKFAEIRIHDIASLEPNNLIEKNYMVVCCVSPYNGKNVGKIFLSFSFQTVADTYNISSTIIPTTDQKYAAKSKTKKSKVKRNKDFKVSKHVPRFSEHPKIGITQPPPKLKSRTTGLPKPIHSTTHPLVSMFDTIKPPEPTPDGDMDISFVVGPGSKLNKTSHNVSDCKKESTPLANKYKAFDRKPSVQFQDKADVVHYESLLEDDCNANDDDHYELLEVSKVNEVQKEKAYSYVDKRGDSVYTEVTNMENMENNVFTIPVNKKTELLGSLINKGNTLRDKMTLSSLTSQRERLNNDEIQQKNNMNPSNSLLAELLNNISEEDSFQKSESSSNIEEKAVTLLLGNNDNKTVKALLEKYNLSESDDEISEAEDPLHDSSLLADLFYTKETPQTIDESSIIFSDNDDSKLSSKTEHCCPTLHQKYVDVDTDSNMLKLVESCVDSETTIMNDEIISQTNYGTKDDQDSQFAGNLTVDQLTTLGRIKSFKVHIHDIHLIKPHTCANSKFFIECKIPVSVDESANMIGADLLRFVSRSCSGNKVSFERFSVFPIQFNERMVDYWWNNSLALKLFIRDKEEKMAEFGKSFAKLQYVLSIDNFVKLYDIPVINKSNIQIGSLKLSLSLACTADKHIKTNYQINIPSANLPHISITQKKNQQQYKINDVAQKKEHCNNINNLTSEREVFKVVKSIKHRQTLHALVMINEAINLNVSTHSPGNYYIVIRVFWSKDILKSKICWNSLQPNFSFQQIIPVEINEEIINKMESNWLIIETWNKQSNPPCDKLCGTSKVSLHQFFVSLKDEKLSEALLRSSYPIISVDDYVTVTMLQSSSASLSQNDNPSLKVLLALGSHHQITQLLEMKSLTQKSSRILHHSNDHRSSTLNYLDGIDKIEHMIEMEIVSIRGLHREMENCFVSYDFPYQKTATGEIKDTTFKIKLNHKLEHNFVLSSNQSMQDMFIRNQDIQHVTFMLFPNQVDWNSQKKPLAKAKLSLSKLFSCIQTQHGDRINFQKLQLELFDEQTRNIGTLELTLKYETRLLNNSESAWKRKSCVSLSIFKLCGLKSGVKMLLKRDSMNGLNCYVKYHLSFYDKFFGTSHVMHQSFSPCSSLHENIELPLILQHQQSRQQSLAQALEDGMLTVQLYCILPCNQSNNGDSSRDVLIGEVIYPTRYLLSHVTGYRNWFAIKYFSTIHNKEIISGGMEIEMKFVNQCDREEVINVGRGFGWHPRVNVDLSAENWLSPSNGFDEQKCCFRLEIKRLKITRNSIEDLFGENEDYDARKEKVVYARYKFYNRAAVCTKAVKITESIDEMHCGMDHIDLFKLHSSASLAWYLREERFEIQYWIRCHDDNDDRMFVDEYSKLIGSCYIDLSELSKSPSFSHTICDYYCLFKMGANEICDSKACLLISFNQSADSSEVCFGREVMSRDIDQSKDIRSDNSKKEKMMTSNETQMNDAKDDDTDIISVSIQIEEALHIKSMLQTNDGVSSFYVSYELDANNFTTTLVTSSAKFVWNFQREEKMSKHVLKSRNIEFKLWRCMGEVIGRDKDILIGVAIVDTSPLFSGLRQLNGWYHLLDFNRQPVGELKVGIIPQALISPSRATKYFKKIDFLQPINLEYTSFQSNGLQKNRDTFEGTSKTMLVDRLKEKLNDLDNITKLLSSKSTRSGNEKCTNSNQPAEVFNNVKLNLVTNQVPENITTDRSVSGDSGNVNMQVDINEKSFDNVLNDTFNSVTYNVQSNDGDEDRTLDENCGSIDDSKSESSSDESSFRVDMHRNSSDGVSTPNNNTPPMVTPSNAFCDNKQNEIETSFSGKINSKSPSEDFSSDNTSDKSFESHRSDIQNFHQDDVGMVSLDDDVNVSPRDDDAPIEHHPRDDDASIEYGPRDRLTDDCKTNEMRVSPISYSSIAQASLPNFFMKTEELADSMRALRLAANFKYSPRSSSSTDSSVTTPSLSTNRQEKRRCFDGQHHKVQEQIKDHLPISDNEMERIKNIFLSKNSSLD